MIQSEEEQFAPHINVIDEKLQSEEEEQFYL